MKEVMLAQTFLPKKHDPQGWWMSEKLDGARCYYDGFRLRSRDDKPFNAPQWWLDRLPRNIELDGELWCGRGRFQTLISYIRKKVPVDAEWHHVKYMVFDSCSMSEAFRTRYHRLNAILEGNKVAQLVEQTACKDRAHLETFYKFLLAQGAEGVMLKNPGCDYIHGRSNQLLKYKPTFDSEAVVIGYEPGEGKHKGRLGALVCNWNGKVFRIGTGLTDKERENPPELNSVVTFEYKGVTDDGMPRHPSYKVKRDYE